VDAVDEWMDGCMAGLGGWKEKEGKTSQSHSVRRQAAANNSPDSISDGVEPQGLRPFFLRIDKSKTMFHKWT
jgi:hypothetical protein